MAIFKTADSIRHYVDSKQCFGLEFIDLVGDWDSATLWEVLHGDYPDGVPLEAVNEYMHEELLSGMIRTMSSDEESLNEVLKLFPSPAHAALTEQV